MRIKWPYDICSICRIVLHKLYLHSYNCRYIPPCLLTPQKIVQHAVTVKLTLIWINHRINYIGKPIGTNKKEKKYYPENKDKVWVSIGLAQCT